MSVGVAGIPPIAAGVAGPGAAAEPPEVPRPAQPGGAGGEPGFGDLVAESLQRVSELEFGADELVQKMAAGADVAPHEVMIAASKANLAVQMTVAVRDRALDAYREIMGLQL